MAAQDDARKALDAAQGASCSAHAYSGTGYMNHAAPLTAIRDALVGGGQAQLATAEAIAALAGEVRELRTEIAAVAYAATQPAPQTEAMRAMAEEIAVLRAEVDALKTKPAEPRRVLRNLLGGGQ